MCSIDTYVSELRQILERTLSSQYAEEIAAEAQNHLCERATELRTTGFSSTDAESKAIEEFGELHELAVELAEGYPPKSSVDPRRLRFLPEIAVVVLLSGAGYSFSVYGGLRGIEAAAGNLLPSMPILMVPGMVAGVSRLKYRRLRPLATLTRMAIYGLGLSMIATACLAGLQIAGRATLISVFPMYYVFAVATALMYEVMNATFADGKVYAFLRGYLRTR